MADIPAVRCPACDKKFRTKADVRGKRIRCPSCSESFIVPVAEEETDDDDAPIPIQGEPGPARDDDTRIPIKGELQEQEEQPIALTPAGEEGEDPYAVTHLDLAPRCPNCADKMPSATAVVCLNCGYNTLTREWGKTAKVVRLTFKRHFAYLAPALGAAVFVIVSVVGLLYFSIVSPYDLHDTMFSFTNSEAIRMWGSVIFLFWLFGAGTFCIKKFIDKPKPEDIMIEDVQ